MAVLFCMIIWYSQLINSLQTWKHRFIYILCAWTTRTDELFKSSVFDIKIRAFFFGLAKLRWNAVHQHIKTNLVLSSNIKCNYKNIFQISKNFMQQDMKDAKIIYFHDFNDELYDGVRLS